MDNRFAAARVLVLVVLLGSTPDGRSQTPSPPETDSTLPKWKDGALVAPLPSDPEARKEAIAQARRLAAARAAQRPASFGLVSRTIEPGARIMPRMVDGGQRRDTRAAESLSPRQRETLAWLERVQRQEAPAEPPAAPAIEVADDRAMISLPSPETAPTLLTSFFGVDDDGLAPMSPDIAVGPQHLIAAAGRSFIVRDKCGNNYDQGTFQSFFGLPANYSYFDPKVIYDEWDNRWVMLIGGVDYAGQQARLFLMVSLSPSPQAWQSYEISFALAGNYPLHASLAVSPDGLYITANEFNFTPFVSEGATLMEASKADVYDFNGFSPYYTRGLTHPIDATLATFVTPAQMHSFPGEVYLVASRASGGSSFTLWTIAGPPGASLLLSANIPVPAYTTPPNLRQPDLSYLEAGSCRVTDCVFDGDYVFAGYGRAFGANPTVAVRRIHTGSLATTEVFLGGVATVGYLGFDIDENGLQTWCYVTSSTGTFPTATWVTLDYGVPALTGGGTLGAGLANYTIGGSGTDGSPWIWGSYYGVARDPSDDRTMWVHGAYASNSPTPSWSTNVGAVTTFTPSHLEVLQFLPAYSGGPEGGPFSTDIFQFNLQNLGSTGAHWEVSGIPSWLSIDDFNGSLDPGEAQLIGFHLTPAAYALTAGAYVANLQFTNCTGTGDIAFDVTLGVGFDGPCAGAGLDLFPPIPTQASGTTTREPGVFVTAVEDVTLCAVGFTADVQVLPQTAYARIYAANGTTRGTLLNEGVVDLVLPGVATHYIPVDITLQACNEYEIVFLFTDDVLYDVWDETAIAEPFDTGGMIRVRDSSRSGNPTTTLLAPIELVTTPAPCAALADFYPGGSLAVDFDASLDVGAYVQALEGVRLCSLGLKMGAAAGTEVRAKVYVANAGTREYLLAEGSAVASGPLTFVDVPIHARLLPGWEYDFAIETDATTLLEFDASPVTPYTQDGLFLVQEGESEGVGIPILPHIRAGWTADQAGARFDLGLPNGPFPPPLSKVGTLIHGAWVTSLIDQEMYSLGVYSNIPAGQTIVAWVFPASGTVVTGPAIASSTALSTTGGVRWHDLPIAASLTAGTDYLFEVWAFGATSTPMWLDSPGLPYNAYGTIRVREGSEDGTTYTQIPNLRICACNATATPVVDGPARVPMFLEPPVPNPANGQVRFGYAIDEAGPAEITVYDVAGRRVAELFVAESARMGAAGVDFDGSTLASGVYFVKLTTRTKSLSRKFVIAH